MGSLAFSQGVNILQRRGEHRTLCGLEVINLWTLEAVLALQTLDLLQTLRTGRLKADVALACMKKCNKLAKTLILLTNNVIQNFKKGSRFIKMLQLYHL